MSIEVMNLVWKNAPYKENTLLTFLALADWSNDQGESWPAVETLAKKCRQCERSCRYALRKLEREGFLDTHFRKDNSSVYRINLAKLVSLSITPSQSRGANIAPLASASVPGGQFTTPGGQFTTCTGATVAPNTSILHTSIKQPSKESGLLFDLGKSEKYTEVTSLPEWKEFLEMRRKQGHPLVTDGAKGRIIGRLRDFEKKGHPIRLVLQQSCDRTWTDVYELKNGNKPAVKIEAEPDALEVMRAKEKARYANGH